MSQKETFERALILIDMLSGDEYFAQCPSALSGCVLASSPPPSCAYSGDFQSVVRGPPVVAPTGSQVGAQSRFGGKSLGKGLQLIFIVQPRCCNHEFHQKV